MLQPKEQSCSVVFTIPTGGQFAHINAILAFKKKTIITILSKKLTNKDELFKDGIVGDSRKH